MKQLCHLRKTLQSSLFISSVTSYRGLASTAPHVCIIGSGPAGFYTAQQLLKSHPTAIVDVYEKLPVPFGLVRYGVAPDHQEVKNVINTFRQTAQNERFSFIGNVTVGRDVSVKELREAYSAVVLCYGAEDDRQLNIPGENLQGVMSARKFVGWYNGLPEFKNLNPDLSCDSAVVLGHGNVAIDVARILLTPVEILKSTDISQHALTALASSNIKRVYLVGRRGPVQAAFTIKEFRELTKLKQCSTHLQNGDFQDIESYLKELPRPRKRLTELMLKTAHNENMMPENTKQLHFIFKRSPLELLTRDGIAVSGVKFSVNELEGTFGENQRCVATEEEEDISCGLVIKSVGFRGVQLEDSLPFDHSKGVVSNNNGRVPGQPGLYCSGWIRRGPEGVIVNTMACGFDSGKTVVQDLNSGALESSSTGRSTIMDLLKSRGIHAVSFEDWEEIDRKEAQRGEQLGKPREKIIDISEMMEVVKART